mmetsp:Transcript_31367/g.72509  ORF Transcript_31367/g.72509 Transcript_31367/m.72509 type:complete len:268 (+) Transcript_31367:372-1175(+)
MSTTSLTSASAPLPPPPLVHCRCSPSRSSVQPLPIEPVYSCHARRPGSSTAAKRLRHTLPSLKKSGCCPGTGKLALILAPPRPLSRPPAAATAPASREGIRGRWSASARAPAPEASAPLRCRGETCGCADGVPTPPMPPLETLCCSGDVMAAEGEGASSRVGTRVSHASLLSSSRNSARRNETAEPLSPEVAWMCRTMLSDAARTSARALGSHVSGSSRSSSYGDPPCPSLAKLRERRKRRTLVPEEPGPRRYSQTKSSAAPFRGRR